MTYQKLAILGFGVAMGLLAVALPFAGLEQFAGDASPVIGALAILALAIGCFVLVHRPEVLEPYVKLASLAFFVLMLLGVLGLLSEMSPNELQASAAPLMPVGETRPMWMGGK